LAGKPGKIVQVAIAIPLFEIQTIEHALEVWLYAPLRSVVYESRDGNRLPLCWLNIDILKLLVLRTLWRIPRAFRIQDANTIPSSKAVFGRSANKLGVPDNNSRSTITSLVYL